MKKTWSLLDYNKAELIKKAFDFFKGVSKTSRPPPIEIVVLGVGCAIKETRLLKAIIEHPEGYNYIRGMRKFGPIHYIPIDISFPLLQNNLRAIFADKDLKTFVIEGNLRIDPILTDFIRGRTVEFLDKNACRLVVAQGIVWNVPVPDIFETFKQLMNEKTLLLIDVEFIGDRTDEEIKRNYSGTKAKEFFYHPLRMLYEVSKGEDYFMCGSRRVHYRDAFGKYSKGEVNVDIVRRDELRKFVQNLGLNEESERMIRITNDNKSKIVIIWYKPSSPATKPIILGYSTRFDFNEFEKFY